MKRTLTIGIVVLSIAGTAVGQMPNIIENTRTKLNTVEQQKGADLNAALPGAQRTSAKPSPIAAKPSGTAPNASPASAKPGQTIESQKSKTAANNTAASKSTTKPISKVTEAKTVKAKTNKASDGKVLNAKAKAAQTVAGSSTPANPQPLVAVEDTKNPLDSKKIPAKKQINLTGRRDPFLSPVVARAAGGSGCSNGKRCLAIDQIALKGVVKSETGMIAVVTNALEKAYFLHENDPVFNGYVVRITGDSIVFKETIQDRLGKALTREVTKKITAPAV
jgi:Tfp pilus assembly protein PilP